MKQLKRICMNPKDVQLITGRTERQGRRILNDIKKRLGKTENQFVTIEEFCRVKGLPLAKVISLLDG
jgi:hypothetical protein